MLLYLDNCVFNRPFDNQQQLRIKIETEAKLFIQEKILKNEFGLVWSYILDYENAVNPFRERRGVIINWKTKALKDIIETDELMRIAKHYNSIDVYPKDALHLACAELAQCDYFITTDDKLIKKAGNEKNLRVVNPVTFIEINNF